MLEQPRQNQLGQPPAQLLIASWLRTELDGGHASANALAQRCRHATGRARGVPPQREEFSTPRTWVVEPGQIGGGAEYLDRCRLIEGVVPWVIRVCRVAAAAQKSRHRQPLRHVFLDLPAVELPFASCGDVIPDDECALPKQRHEDPPGCYCVS